jgi:diaminohydroxyphosphoribosylaminopyrimidine deaminase/5-amino-6-(5-phosphoribosylamino)uracil reductase
VSQEALDRAMMQRALEVGRRGRTAPNPHVGAIVARGDAVVAEGHHEGAGKAHAEVMALELAGAAARGATLYCTLEPCNHHGRTPPCTESILRAGIARVVFGCRDPKTHGAGPGAPRLAAAGVEVVEGIERPACEELVEDFACLALRGRPLVVGKAAVTLDGRIATRTGDSKWITSELARAEAHRLRARADAVMVGVETVLADDPRLTVRLPEGAGPDPLRVVVDTHLRTPPSAQLLSGGPTLIAHGPHASAERRAALSAATLLELPLASGRVDLRSLLAELGRRDVMRLLVEGGGTLLGALADADLLDRMAVFVAPILLGDPEARPVLRRSAPVPTLSLGLRLDHVATHVFGSDVLVEGRVPRKE